MQGRFLGNDHKRHHPCPGNKVRNVKRLQPSHRRPGAFHIIIRRPCPSSSLGRAAPGTTLGVELQNQPLHRPNPSLQRRVAFGTVACKCHWLFQLSGICTELFFPVPRLPPGPFNPFPAASSGLSTCCLANANGFSSCRGSAQSFFFRFQDCRLAPSNPSLQRPVAFGTVAC